MKPAEEIKKGLEGLKFIANAGRIDDALALIQQLEAQNAQLNRCIENMTDKLNAAHDEIAKLQGERDALISDFEEYDELPCALCEHYSKATNEIPCKFCKTLATPTDEDRVSQWQWRGVQKEG